MGLGPDAELLVDEEVIPRAASAGTTGGYCVGDVGCGTAPVCDGLTAGFGDEVDSTGAEDVIEVCDGRGEMRFEEVGKEEGAEEVGSVDSWEAIGSKVLA